MDDNRAGWYSDPWGEAELRYYDGVDWTNQVASRAAQAVEPAGSTSSKKRRSWNPRAKRPT
jgi:hypothetical protein